MGTKTEKPTVKCKVKVLRPLPGVFTEYQPIVGAVYEADYRKVKFYNSRQNNSPVCVIKIRDKSICLKTGEYEILEDL